MKTLNTRLEHLEQPETVERIRRRQPGAQVTEAVLETMLSNLQDPDTEHVEEELELIDAYPEAIPLLTDLAAERLSPMERLALAERLRQTAGAAGERDLAAATGGRRP